MARPVTGGLLRRDLKQGRTYAMRVWANGERHYVQFGTVREGWTEKRAVAEMERICAAVRAGTWVPPRTTGVWMRHSRSCSSQAGGGVCCDCSPHFAAWVWSKRAGRKIWRTFATETAAIAWRREMRDVLAADNPITELRALAEARIATQELEMGEALPHLLVARDLLARVERQATKDAEFLWRDDTIKGAS